jgi:AbrB family looped-hinge helix DNA binding protein
MTSTVNKAGRTTIPAGVRRKAGWDIGATLDWQVEGNKVVVRRLERQDVARTVRLVRKNGRLCLPSGVRLYSEAVA